MIVTDVLSALRAGKELANAKTWKNAQARTASLTAFLAAAVGIAASLGYPIPFSSEQITLVVAAIGVLYGLFMWVATLVSTTRIGLPPRAGDPPTGSDQRTGDDPPARSPERPERPAAADADDDGPVPYLNETRRG